MSALHSQLASWEQEGERRLASGPPQQMVTAAAEVRNQVWGQLVQQLRAESSARLAATDDRFEVDAAMLRTAISRRLDRPRERSMEVVMHVASPVDPSAMTGVADDLDALVRLLPEDGKAGAPWPERRERVRRHSRHRS